MGRSLALLRANEPHYTANSYQGFKASPYKSSGRLQRKRRSPPPPPGVFRQFPKENLTIEIFVEPDEHDFLGNITSKTDAMQVAKGFIFKHGIDIVHADSVRYQIQRSSSHFVIASSRCAPMSIASSLTVIPARETYCKEQEARRGAERSFSSTDICFRVQQCRGFASNFPHSAAFCPADN